MPQQSPLRVQVICPDPGVRAQFEDALKALGRDRVIYQAMAGYPSGTELARAIRALSPQVVFLSFEKLETALAVVRYLESEVEGMPVVGLYHEADSERMRQSMRVGARDFLMPPFGPAEVGAVLDDLRKVLRKAPLSYMATEHIYSFLPAKPGVGATTVAINTSVAFARETGHKVLLSDLDLACGVLRFLLKLPQDLSIVDALARAEDMDAFLWPQLVAERDGIDMLHSGGINPHAFLEIPQVQGLIDFARCNYGALFFDMSGNLERHSMYVMQESKQVFVVCNPDPGSLYQGREKIQVLSSMGLGGRLRAIVNRSDQALAVPAHRVAEFLGVPVAASLSDDTFEVSQSIQRAQSLFGSGLKPGRLSRQYREFATLLAAREQSAASERPSGDRELAVVS